MHDEQVIGAAADWEAKDRGDKPMIVGLQHCNAVVPLACSTGAVT